MNESLKVSDLKVPPECTVITSPDEIVVSVVPPQILRVAEEEALPGEEAAEEAAEGEGEPVEKPESEE